MSEKRFSTFHFSQANPRGAGQDNVPALLRRVADTIDSFGDIEVGDLILHSDITPEGEMRPSITVYYDNCA